MISSLSYYSNLLGNYLSVDSTSFEDLIPNKSSNKVERISSDVNDETELEDNVEAVALQALPSKSDKPSRVAYKAKRKAIREPLKALKALRVLAENGDGQACFKLLQYHLGDPDARSSKFSTALTFLNKSLAANYRIAQIARRFILSQKGADSLFYPAVFNVLVTMHPTDENKIDKRLRELR